MTTIDYPHFVSLLDGVARQIDDVLDSDMMDAVVEIVADLEGIDSESGEQEVLEAENRIRVRAMLILINELVQRHGLTDHVSITIPTR